MIILIVAGQSNIHYLSKYFLQGVLQSSVITTISNYGNKEIYFQVQQTGTTHGGSFYNDCSSWLISAFYPEIEARAIRILGEDTPSTGHFEFIGYPTGSIKYIDLL